MLKKIYLLLAVLGFVIPSMMVLTVFVKTEEASFSDLLLWLMNPANKLILVLDQELIPFDFTVDILILFVIFFVWTYFESRRYSIKYFWAFWLLAIFTNLVTALPAFLYYRESKIKVKESYKNVPVPNWVKPVWIGAAIILSFILIGTFVFSIFQTLEAQRMERRSREQTENAQRNQLEAQQEKERNLYLREENSKLKDSLEYYKIRPKR